MEVVEDKEVVRKSVETYFNDILKKIISTDLNFSIGYDFVTEAENNIFISTNKPIGKPFGSESSSIKMWNSSIGQIKNKIRLKRALISIVLLSLLLTIFYFIYFQSEYLYKLYVSLF